MGIILSFSDELLKLAAKVPFIHGTAARHKILMPGIGRTILKNDPNPRAVYTAMSNRAKKKSIDRFAREAAKSRSGSAVVASGKMDTKKGWMPNQLTPWGKKNIGDLDDARALVEELDTASKPRRGEIWRALHKGTGQWRNDNASKALRVNKHLRVKS